MASHSRFTDDVWCTPVPTAPQIDVRTIDELRDEIFQPSIYEEYKPALFQAEEMKSKDLYEKYSPSFRHPNKQFIFKFINEIKHYSPSSNKSLLVTRWRPFLPEITPSSLSPTSTKVTFKSDAFTYDTCGNNQTVEWYLNFANHDLFAYYSGPLLAQDELQVLECIELAALREFFVQTTNAVDSRTTASDRKTHETVPTPILISNTERVINIDTNKVYGNAFAQASQRQLMQACSYLEKPQIVNVIAIEAPSNGRGAYSRDQVKYILITSYVGFQAAKILASKTHALNKAHERRSSRTGETQHLRTLIHTGWWGCGAYGNNRQMMILAQILAAYWAQIDEIIFHTQSTQYEGDIKAAKALAEKLLKEKQIDNVIDQIVQLNLQWERSNNT